MIALIVASEKQAAARRRLVLLALRHELGGAAPQETASIAGQRRGQAVTFRFTSRGTGKSRRPWTEIDVAVPPGPLSFALREQRPRDESLRDRGLVVDVETGDEAFDDAFIVEAAPADIARALLDEELRRVLLAARPFAVVPSNGVLRVEVPGHVENPPRAAALVDLAARLAAGIRPAHAAADAALEAAAPRVGSPYRAGPQGEAVRAAKRARLDELAALAAVKERRHRHGQLVAAGIIVLIVVVYALIMWSNRQ